MNIEVNSVEETQKIAEKLGQLVEPNMILLLDGDLGAGKTTFAKGLAVGLGITRNVKSPTFPIVREYREGRLSLFHMDVYRLEGMGGADLGLDEYFNSDGVSVVEWSEFIQDELPDDSLRITLLKDEDDDNRRVIKLDSYGSQYTRILEQLVKKNG
ncbi:tRNA (adenosine(37)-N6)-threonylcarbamoyltransferase complex ATPase subunit type 1 TsaE [Dellaglioa algida]|uniref:tRNA threonylcarbamoyladenosine biosynthesis protein TsaE n=1 Tax=Dellaglioa algida DSM 15638 TaxID=1423719 RepID=A0A0R1HIL7_9LACO|nr:tRNA (adenosine(37)-N6)-threonylcarbamoyltransferase complex ATPase subunit type 1 TsaE [Dellaglioa algida]KRK46159.1 ATP GTP hydrolase [Dellaglioa algida DSM 15638]MDK1732168.1 tRNA (adenosine(37)-N6)-threonylcarbamoyltransferase complex ATPase subunit type 1 TsaE [Dellaglioa algida]MDK1733694.1 tRNA (adenosine(37)-N6)-threonylcarbamoyltransferase complex ATPase subunit type 1 TsaE [Dellaglioa algida]